MYNLFTMDNKEVTTSKERVLIAIQGITLLLFLSWWYITSGSNINVIVEYVIYGVLGLVFLVSHILYMIHAYKARKAAKKAFFDSVQNREQNIFDDYDDDVFGKYDAVTFDTDNNSEEKN